MARTETRRILIKAVGKDLKTLDRAAKGINRINKNTRRTSQVLSQFRNVFAAAFAVQQLRSVGRFIDSIVLLEGRINAIEGSAEAGARSFEDLFAAANFTRASVTSLADSYARLRLATQDLNVSQEATTGLTIALQQSFRLAGATAAEASGAVIQLGQGLASSQLRGQELRSVLEANAVAGTILAEEFGIARGQLIKFAETGQITSDRVIRAFANNIERLNEQTAKLPQTIEQSVILALNDLRQEALALEKQFNITGNFAKGIRFVTDNLQDLAAVVLAVGGAFATSAIISSVAGLGSTLLKASKDLIKFITALRGAQGVLAATKFLIAPITVALTALVGSLIFLATVSDETKLKIKRFFVEIKRDGLNSIADLTQSLNDFLNTINIFKDVDFSSFTRNVEKEASQTSEALADLNFKIANLGPEGRENGIDRFVNALKEAAETIQPVATQADNFRVKLANLNFELSQTGDIERYNRELDKLNLERLNRQFDRGEINFRKFNDQLDERKLQNLNQAFNRGTINITDFNQAIAELELRRIERGVRQGTSSVLEFQEAVLKTRQEFDGRSSLAVGVSNFLQNAGTLSSNIAESITDTFGRLEDSLVNFTQTGKFEFREFTRAILDDLNRIIIRQFVVRQLAAGIGDFVGGGAQPTNLGATVISPDRLAANGAAFNSSGEITAFANGGIVDRPTIFGFGRGQTGLMGEAGAEAILPLRRDSQGDLGVKATPSNVNINIINNANNTEVETREIEDQFGNKQLDFIITQTVAQGFAEGTFDRSLRNNFGLSRRGL